MDLRSLAEIEDIGDIKKRIIAKSSKLFITQGYNKTTIRRIAEESGLGRGHLYYYFKKKENILLQIYKSFLEKIYKYIIDNHTLGSSTLVSYAVSQYLYTNIIVNSDALFRIYIEASKVDIIRKEYVNILIDLFDEKVKESEYDFSERDIYLSVTIGCAGESELLNRYYEKSIDLTLEEIIKSIITTRLLLLNIDSDSINKIIDETMEIVNKIDIKDIKTIEEISTFFS